MEGWGGGWLHLNPSDKMFSYNNNEWKLDDSVQSVLPASCTVYVQSTRRDSLLKSCYLYCSCDGAEGRRRRDPSGGGGGRHGDTQVQIQSRGRATLHC